jgi:hypothetical protein
MENPIIEDEVKNEEKPQETPTQPEKRGRGRPKGSKNKPKLPVAGGEEGSDVVLDSGPESPSPENHLTPVAPPVTIPSEPPSSGRSPWLKHRP